MSLLEIGSIEARPPALSSRYTIMGHRARERLLIVNGHPDPRPERFCAALCGAYLSGVTAAGRGVDFIALGATFPITGHDSSAELTRALDILRQSERLTVIFPLWLDKPPEIVTRFFQHAERDGDTKLRSRRAHIVVTMALPAFAHRSMLREQESAHRIQHSMSLPGVEIDSLNFVGSVDTISRAQREEWLHRLRRLGSGRN